MKLKKNTIGENKNILKDTKKFEKNEKYSAVV